MARITLVKKIGRDGRPCRACIQVQARLERDGLGPRIDRVLAADERDPHGEGWALARALRVTRAPFFVVESGGATEVHTDYDGFVAALDGTGGASDAALLRATPALDWL